MSGTYPGSTTYPSSSLYPGAGPASGTASVTFIVSPTFTAVVVARGAATVTFTADPSLRLGSPTQGFANLILTVSPTLTMTQFGSISTNPSLAGFPDPVNSPPRVLLQASNITGPTATVTRYGTDGQATVVRSGDPAPLNSGGWIGYDYEAPYNQPVYYVIQSADGSAPITSPAVTLTVSRPWLVHPGVPALSQPVTVKLLDAETMAGSGGLHPVMGRATSIPVTDGRRKAPSYSMLLKTGSADDSDALDQLFYDTAPLLLQMVYPYTTESVYQWLYVADIQRARPSLDFSDPRRVWTLAVSEVDRPEGGLQAQRTWADVMAECPTWKDVLARYKTWRGVLTGIPGT